MAANAFMSALEEQVECYRRLAKLAEAQHEHVQQGQTESLLQVLFQRQEVVDRLSVLEAEVGPARRRWEEFAASLEGSARAKAKSLLAEARRLLEQITAADRNDALVLQQRKLSLSRQITQAAAAKQVNRTYAAAAYGARPPRMDVQR